MPMSDHFHFSKQHFSHRFGPATSVYPKGYLGQRLQRLQSGTTSSNSSNSSSNSSSSNSAKQQVLRTSKVVHTRKNTTTSLLPEATTALDVPKLPEMH
mmetsp:Transcript_4690/g.13138  ORF Transcript_4690/g.13138 Transcript_4690/m.13138 type:complete len:98 (+) Transcript_4690:537-830(+)